MPSGGSGMAPSFSASAGTSSTAFLAFDEEVVVIAHIGVEIGPRAIDRELAQEACLGELVQRVVDGGERHRHAGLDRLGVQPLGGHVPVALREQELAERQALLRRTQAGATQQSRDIGGRRIRPPTTDSLGRLTQMARQEGRSACSVKGRPIDLQKRHRE